MDHSSQNDRVPATWRDEPEPSVSADIVKSWTVSAVSEGDAPLRLLSNGKLVVQSLPGSLDQVCPVEYLLLAVAGCFALSCRAVLQRRVGSAAGALPSTNVEITATGEKIRGGGNRVSRISVTAMFDALSDEEAAATVHEAEALCTVTNTLHGSPAITYTARATDDE